MRYGFRKPNFNKSFKARTTGRLTRSYKRALNPYYGRKGMGYLHNPRKAIYNDIYHRTTVPLHTSHRYHAYSHRINNNHISYSKTPKYHHNYYMKRKYGYTPTDSNVNDDDSDTYNDMVNAHTYDDMDSSDPVTRKTHQEDANKANRELESIVCINKFFDHIKNFIFTDKFILIILLIILVLGAFIN